MGVGREKARREGKGGKVFPGPAKFGEGARHRSKILKRVFQMAS